jgi:hypothetical protein
LTGGGASAQSGNFDATITGNTIANPGNNPAAAAIAKNGVHLNGGTVPGDTYQVCMDIGGAGALENSIVGSGAPNDGGAGGEDFRLRQRQSTTVRLPGYGGGTTDAAAVISFVQGRNAGTPTGSVSFNAPPGGGYVGGAACTPPSFAMIPDQISGDYLARRVTPLEHTNVNLLSTINTRAVGEYAPASSTSKSRQVVRVSEFVASSRTPARSKEGSQVHNKSWIDKSSFSEDVSSENRSASAKPKHERAERRRLHHARAYRKSASNSTAAATTSLASPALAAVEVDLPNLPAGESIKVVFDVTVDSRRGSYSAQGTVTATGITPVLTDDPDVGGATDPTVTPGDCQPTFSVTSIADVGAGTLREGISQLCDGGTIDFNIAGAGPHTITLTTGQLLIDKDLTITNTSGESVTVNGGGTSRILSIDTGKTTTIRNLTVSGGAPTDAAGGGGILNNGTLSLINMTLSGSVSGNAIGGGVSNNSVLTVINSTISGNDSGVGGGGLSASGTSTTTVINSTISGNTSNVDGGGIYTLDTSAITLINCTITGNRADNDNDTTGTGGGISGLGGTVTLRNTIVAGNFNEDGASDAADDIGGTVDAASSFNLIGTGGSGDLIDEINSNQVGVADARLGPLANNGGPTLTHAPFAGSPALDAGDNAFVTDPPFNGPGFTDQRDAGFARILDAADVDTVQTVDIGAFEADPSVEDISDKATNEDTALPTFTFNVGDAATSFDSITAVSSNATLVPNVNITVGADTPSRGRYRSRLRQTSLALPPLPSR